MPLAVGVALRISANRFVANDVSHALSRCELEIERAGERALQPAGAQGLQVRQAVAGLEQR